MSLYLHTAHNKCGFKKKMKQDMKYQLDRLVVDLAAQQSHGCDFVNSAKFQLKPISAMA